jgi:uncharacterized membrane protein (UPF0127 family)
VILALGGTVQAATQFHFELAETEEQRIWGLMQRESLEPDHGMLFLFPQETHTAIWSFNCLIDLDVLFIDADWTILAIRHLRAYPEMMRALPPVHSIQDMKRIPANHPVIAFFEQQGVHSPSPYRYVLEMEAGWSKKRAISSGDKVSVDWSTGQGWISPSQQNRPSAMKSP